MLSMCPAYTASVFTVGLAGLTTGGRNTATVPLSNLAEVHQEVVEEQQVLQVLEVLPPGAFLGAKAQVAFLVELAGDLQVLH